MCSLSGALYWMKQLFITNLNFIKNGCYLFSEHFSTLPQSEIQLFHNCTPKNLFPTTCYYWEATISLRKVDQKFLHGQKFGYGDSYLDSVFCYCKVIRPTAILRDAAGAVRLPTGKGPG